MNSNQELCFKVLNKAWKICLYVVFMAIALFMIIPFVWMVSISFKSSIPYYQNFLALIPTNFTLKNYITTWVTADFSVYFKNTVIFAGVSTMLTVFLCALGGYVFAQLRFPGRHFLFMLVLISMMIPESASMIPRFLIIKFFPMAGGNNLWGQGGYGLFDSHAGLILPYAVTGYGLFLLRQFFIRLPTALRDSAKIDGCSEFRIFWQIMLPLAKPAVIALTIFSFTWRWNKLLWPLVVTQTKEMRVIGVGLAVFLGERRTIEQWNEMMAASTIAIVPVVVLFFILQKYFTRGISLTGLKG